MHELIAAPLTPDGYAPYGEVVVAVRVKDERDNVTVAKALVR